MDANYLRAIHRSIGIDSSIDLTIADAQERVRMGMQTSVNYKADAKRNGKRQAMCLVPTKTRYKSTFVCLPGDDIKSGDMIECDGDHWLVIETNTTNPIQHIGMAWLCNHEFRFQNWSPEIISRYGVLDSGVFSTTQRGDDEVMELNKQFKIYLPLDEDTKKIYVDKRFAVDTRYDSYGTEILECYVITGLNSVARSYGEGGHLLVLDARSSNYSPEHDNMALMICDYIQPNPNPPTSSTFTISGNSRVSVGTDRRFYIPEVNAGESFEWESDNHNVLVKADHTGATALVSVKNNYGLIGESVTITATQTGTENSATIVLEVIP